MAPSRVTIIRQVQRECAWLLANRHDWDERDAAKVASLLNQDDDPWGLFRYMDEQTGSSDVGYRIDGREWFPIFRQMRNTPGSGLLEKLEKGA